MSVRVSLVASLVSAVLLAACSSDDTPPGSVTDGSGSSRKLKTLEDGDAFIGKPGE